MSKIKNKKRTRIIWRTVLSVLLIIAVGANIALYHFSDVISAYFSTIDMDSKEAVAAREKSTDIVEQIADEGIVLLKNDDHVLPLKTSKEKSVRSMFLVGVLQIQSMAGRVPVQRMLPQQLPQSKDWNLLVLK